MNKKIKKFENAKSLKCIKCQEKLTYHNGVLKCQNNHSYDIAAKGYVNFVLNAKENNVYNKVFFENRSEINNQGFYKYVLNGIIECLKLIDKSELILADLGCGEGYYALELSNNTNYQIYALDYAKDAIINASKSSNIPYWIVGDIANVPLLDNSIDVVLNIFSPANYLEFNRILKTDGYLIKVVPRQEHFKEIRKYSNSKEYSNEKIIEHFKNNFEIIHTKEIINIFKVNEKQVTNLINMTPLMFNLDVDDKLNLDINKVTVAADIIIGKKIYK
ncbi:23S rRNA (guanine745-N1)-methyltransferase [Bacilli bacterium PM5-9]|nr:23S rRNA (guanine745-N1)-methyltransferase [Bacilli bacterium PM5-9]